MSDEFLRAAVSLHVLHFFFRCREYPTTNSNIIMVIYHYVEKLKNVQLKTVCMTNNVVVLFIFHNLITGPLAATIVSAFCFKRHSLFV